MEYVEEFEKAIADFYCAPYAVATDCCTHAIELCLRYEQPKYVECPNRTYVSIPMTLEKLGISWDFTDKHWYDYYLLDNTRIVDAAVYWKKSGYIYDSLMCLSFQFRKHLNLGRGGAILCSTKEEYEWLKKASYDGRLPNKPWAEQNISTLGYHYYMTPETAQLGLDKLPDAIATKSRVWDWSHYPDLTQMDVFK